jgi:NDP-sugar pyrophosphorylase family protein
MDAFLLCAGFGTRMGRRTDDTPKSLLEIAGRSFLGHLAADLLDGGGLDAVHLAVNHRDAAAFRNWAATWRPRFAEHGTALHVHNDGVTTPDEQLGALGDLRVLLDRIDRLPEDGALVSGGDSLYRFPLAPLLTAFDGSRSRVLALYEPDPDILRQRSVLDLDGSRVRHLVEAPDAPPSCRVCPSWYLLTRDALAEVGPYLDAGRDPDTLGPFVDHVAQRQRVDAVLLPDAPRLRLHCNTPADLQRARSRLANAPMHLLDAAAVREAVSSCGP